MMLESRKLSAQTPGTLIVHGNNAAPFIQLVEA